MQRHRRSLRFGTLFALGLMLLVAVGCASAPSAGRPLSSPLPSTVHASIDEAALAGLTAARSNATVETRRAIRVGAIRRVEGGYVWLPPSVADAGLHAGRPGVIRFRRTDEDVASYVVHPASGDAQLDRMNAELSPSESRLLASPTGRPRPVYLLTPRLEVVRFAGEQTSTEIASLCARRCGSPSIGETVRHEVCREEKRSDRDAPGSVGGSCRSDQRLVGQRPA